MEISFARQLADLANHGAYQYIIEELQRDLSEIENALQKPSTPEKDISALNRWRAYREVLGRLKGIPDFYREKLEAHFSDNPEHRMLEAAGRAMGIELQ